MQRATPLQIAPALLFSGRQELVRGWIDGVALHIAKPQGDHAYFRSAKAVLRRLHRAGIVHNDLAKEQNWLRGADGRCYLTDFQLAFCFSRRSRLFRVLAYEDLRHLLKHKRRYLPEALTPAELRVLARKSWFTRIWMATGKKVYRGITRGIFNFTDREGGGPRLVNDAPVIAARLREHPSVRDVAIVAFPDRRAGTGLYAFVEVNSILPEKDLRDFLGAKAGPAAPEHLQMSAALPRDAVRRGAHGNPAACRHEPGGIDRQPGRQRQRTRGDRPHRGRAAQSARPLRLLARDPEPVFSARPWRGTPRRAPQIHCRRHCGTSIGAKGS